MLFSSFGGYSVAKCGVPVGADVGMRVGVGDAGGADCVAVVFVPGDEGEGGGGGGAGAGVVGGGAEREESERGGHLF